MVAKSQELQTRSSRQHRKTLQGYKKPTSLPDISCATGWNWRFVRKKQDGGGRPEMNRTPTQQRVAELVENDWQNRRVLVIGDVMLDKYVWGRVEGVLPEAP